MQQITRQKAVEHFGCDAILEIEESLQRCEFSLSADNVQTTKYEATMVFGENSLICKKTIIKTSEGKRDITKEFYLN